MHSVIALNRSICQINFPFPSLFPLRHFPLKLLTQWWNGVSPRLATRKYLNKAYPLCTGVERPPPNAREITMRRVSMFEVILFQPCLCWQDSCDSRVDRCICLSSKWNVIFFWKRSSTLNYFLNREHNHIDSSHMMLLQSNHLTSCSSKM